MKIKALFVFLIFVLTLQACYTPRSVSDNFDSDELTIVVASENEEVKPQQSLLEDQPFILVVDNPLLISALKVIHWYYNKTASNLSLRQCFIGARSPPQI